MRHRPAAVGGKAARLLLVEDRTNGLGGSGKGGVVRIDLDLCQQCREACGRAVGVIEFLLQDISDHAFCLGPQHIKREGAGFARRLALQREQTDLRTVAMGDDNW